MDENKTNCSENPSVDNSRKLDSFFEQLDANTTLSSDGKLTGGDRYDPDYIDLGDYEKSDTGFVSLREKKGSVDAFDSAGADPAAAPAGAPKNDGAQKKTAGAAMFGKKKAGNGKNGKKGASDDGKQKKNRGWRIFGKIVLYIVCIGVIVACVVTVAAAMYLARVTADDDQLLDLNSLELKYATRLMEKDAETGNWVEYQRIYGSVNRVWVNYEEFPDALVKCVVSSEDQRFWSHKGVDLKRTIFAFVNEYVFRLSSSTQGGSTITQQLVKNITGEKSVGGFQGALRKLREIYRAYMLERKYSKQQILEAYLNTVNFGGEVEGIESAANYYFDTTTKNLTLAQCASIVCITKYPSLYNPFIDAAENKKQREDVVLWGMKNQGAIDETTYKAALAESATFQFTQPGGTASSSTAVYSYFTDTAIREVIRDLQTYAGMTADQANDAFYNGGLTVYLTIDPFIQDTCEDIAMNPKYWENDSSDRFWPKVEYEDQVDAAGNKVLDANGDAVQVAAANQIQSAYCVMNYKGELLGLTGGIRSKDGSLSLNRAVGYVNVDAEKGTYTIDGSVRQTGSSMKPLAVYAPALELNKITYSTLFADAPVTTVGGQPWPRNFDYSYGEAVTVYDGVRRSLNTTAAAVMQLIGPDYSYDFLTTSLGFTTLADNFYTPDGTQVTDRTLSLALGGLSFGCSVYEMTAAYAVFGNGGTYYEPHCYTKVVDYKGNVILDKEKVIEVNKALSDDTAYIMNKILQGVIRGGTGTAMNFGSMPLAGKTGTTSDAKDYWCAGMNPYYVMAVWEGYDQPEKMVNRSPHPSQIAFRKVMSTISENLENKTFEEPDGVVSANYCVASGGLASPACPETAVGYYKKGFLPAMCDHTYIPTKEEAAAQNPANTAAATG